MKYLKTCIFMLLALTFVVSGAVYAQDEDYTVGAFTTNLQVADLFDGFMERMADLGYEDGRNVTYLYDDPPEDINDEEAILAIAQALIDRKPDVIFAPGPVDALFLQGLTDEIPIVFTMASDPVGVGLVEDLTEPGGNITGIEIMGYHQRRLQLLVEIDPTIELVLYPLNTGRAEFQILLEEISEIADTLDVELYVMEYSTRRSLMAAFQEIPDDTDAIFMTTDALLYDPEFQATLMGRAIQLQAGISHGVYTPLPGMLMGYGPDPYAAAQQAARIVDRILRGAEPADLPVEKADFFLVVNLEMAQMIDLEIPRSILRQADMILRPGDLDGMGGPPPEETPEGDE